MAFECIAGQQGARALLESWLQNHRPPPALLLSGPSGTGKRELALELAQALNCRAQRAQACGSCASCRQIEMLAHPDVHALVPRPPRAAGKGAVSQEDMRAAVLNYLGRRGSPARSQLNIAREYLELLQGEMSYAPVEGVWKIALLFEAERMHPAGANSLLKMLEEPPRHALFVLVSAAPERLLPTVLSRCQRLHLRPLSAERVRAQLLCEGMDAQRLEAAVRLGAGSLQRARQVAAGALDEVRRRAERFLQAGTRGEDEVYWTELEGWASKGGRGQVEEMLEMCGLYLRDLFLLCCARPQALVHSDRLEFLQALRPAFAPEQVERTALEVERAFEYLERNVNPRLALADLWRQLRRCGAGAPP